MGRVGRSEANNNANVNGRRGREGKGRNSILNLLKKV